MAVTMSIATHAVVLLAARRPSVAGPVDSGETTFEVSLESPIDPTPPEPAPTAPEQPQAPAAKPSVAAATARRAPETSQARPETSSLPEAMPSSSMTPAAAALTAPEAAPTPRFSMVVGRATAPSAVVSTASSREAAAEPIPAERATTQARLVTRAPVRYPAHARELGIEAAVTVDIVVDVGGHVRSARVVRAAGRGFDEAALDAVANYRFSPAALDGRPVPVRMHWLVEFKLT